MDNRSSSTYTKIWNSFGSYFNPSASATPLDEAALNAAHKIGPRTYVLKGLKNDKKPVYWAVGCQGSGGDLQKKVAELMATIAKTHPDQRPDFILFLGDNIYNYGVNSPTDPKFTTHFHDIYSAFNIPCFLVLGNHDYNLHMIARGKTYNPFKLIQGKYIGFNQAAHTYVPDGKKYKSAKELETVFDQNTLHLKDLQQFNMPYSYYSLIAGNTQIFCLDSNFFAQDFLEYMKGEKKPSGEHTNQIQWLLEEYKKAKDAGREIHFAMHHAPYTSGKRARPSGHDSSDYLDPKIQRPLLNDILRSNTTSYNELILLILKKLGLKPDKILAAHDHFLCIDHNPDFLVLTSGGGGGALQNRESCKRHDDVKLFLPMNGFHVVSEKIDTYTTSGLHLTYDDKKHDFDRQPGGEEKVENMRNTVLKICHDYLNKLKHKEEQTPQDTQEETSDETADEVIDDTIDETGDETNGNQSIFSSIFANVKSSISTMTTTVSTMQSTVKKMLTPHLFRTDDLNCVHEFMAYFNQPDSPDYVDIINYLLDRPEKIKNKKNDDLSFYHFFQNAMKTKEIDLSTIRLGLSSTFVKVKFF